MNRCRWSVVCIWLDGAQDVEYFTTRESARVYAKSIRDAVESVIIRKS